MAQQVDLRGHGGAAFPSARKLQAVVDASRKRGRPTIVVVNATEGEPGSFKDKMLLMRSPYLMLSGAPLAAEAIGAEEIIVGVAGNELANRSLDAAIAASPACGIWCGSSRCPTGSSGRKRCSHPGHQREETRPAGP